MIDRCAALKFYLALFVLLGSVVRLQGQGSVKSYDSIFLSKAEANAISRYTKVMGGQALLYNGREYKEFIGSDNQHPYLESTTSEHLMEGDLFYDEELFRKIPMLYDLVTDELIIERNDPYNFRALIKLNSDLVGYFTVLGHTYRRLTGDSLHVLRTGFYDFIYDGNVKVLAKKWKISHEEINSHQVDVEFKEKVNYYIQKEERYFKVRGKGSVLKVLKDKKRELKQYSNQNKLDFSGDRAGAIVELVIHYDKIKQL